MKLTRRNRRALTEPLERRMLLSAMPVGPEFRVNTYTTDRQWHQSIAMDDEGNFVIAWQAEGQDGSGSGIYAQRYDALGIRQGEEFRVNTYTTGGQGVPEVAMDGGGNFVIVWASEHQDGNGYGVFAQRYDALGVPQGTEFRVNTHTTGSQFVDSVAMVNEGDFIITWASAAQDGSEDGVYAQRFDSAGEPQGSEFRVNTYTTGHQRHPSIAVDGDGDFVVAWTSWGQDGALAGVYAQRFDAAGNPQGSEFRVNTYTPDLQVLPAVAMDNEGDFVIIWRSTGQGNHDDVYAQRYDALGVPQGGEFRVNTYTLSGQWARAVAMDSDGNFVVSWRSFGQDGDRGGIYARCFDASGEPLSGEFRVNTHTTGDQDNAFIAMDADGDFVVTWSSDGQDGHDWGVYAQRYAIAPRVSTSAFLFDTSPHRLRFEFDRDVSLSLGSDDLVVQNLTTMQTIPSPDFAVSYDAATNAATFTYDGILPEGRYEATLLASGVTTSQGAPLPGDHVLSFHFLTGDANGDGRVNLNDFNILAANFGASGRDFTQGNFDYDPDGIVNLNDFNLLAARFGAFLAPAAGSKSTTFPETTDGSPARSAERVIDLVDEEVDHDARID